MDIKRIFSLLSENGLSEVEELRNNEDYVLVNFYLDFDKDILEAAKAYANDECEDSDTKEWMDEYYLPYLYDYANDEVVEIIEEITEELEISGEMMAVQNKEETSGYVQFMTLFTNEDSDVTIEDVVKDYMNSR